MKVNNTNEELFDGLFKQDLGNASSPVPPGAWEGISSSLSSGTAVAGAAVKTAIWMKAAISALVIAGISAAVYQYNTVSPVKTDIQDQSSIVANEAQSDQANEVKLNSESNVTDQKSSKESESVESIDPIRADEHIDHVQPYYDIFDIDVPPPMDGYTLDIGTAEKSTGNTETKNNELDNTIAEEPQPVFLSDPSIKDSSYIEVPDAFTNDGDGINDTYLIKLIGEERVEIIIYTADNQIIFRTKNKYTAWDSRMPNGELAPEGFYFVKVIYKYKNKAESTPIIRRITLIR